MESLRKILEKRGRTQAWLAKAMNVTEATISRYASCRLVNVLAEPSAAHHGLSEPEQAILPARKETD